MGRQHVQNDVRCVIVLLMPRSNPSLYDSCVWYSVCDPSLARKSILFCTWHKRNAPVTKWLCKQTRTSVHIEVWREGPVYLLLPLIYHRAARGRSSSLGLHFGARRMTQESAMHWLLLLCCNAKIHVDASYVSCERSSSTSLLALLCLLPLDRQHQLFFPSRVPSSPSPPRDGYSYPVREEILSSNADGLFLVQGKFTPFYKYSRVHLQLYSFKEDVVISTVSGCNSWGSCPPAPGDRNEPYSKLGVNHTYLQRSSKFLWKCRMRASRLLVIDRIMEM